MQILRVVFCCSCFLLIAVVSQNANYVAATVAPPTTTATNAKFQHVQAALPADSNKNTKQLDNVAAVLKGVDVNTATKHDVDLGNKLQADKKRNTKTAYKNVVKQSVAKELQDEVKANAGTFAVPVHVEQGTLPIKVAESAKEEGEQKTQSPAGQAYKNDEGILFDSEVPKIIEKFVKMPKASNMQTASQQKVVENLLYEEVNTKSKTLNVDKTQNADAITDKK